MVLERLGLGSNRYVLATIHRPNTDNPQALAGILRALATLPVPVIPRPGLVDGEVALMPGACLTAEVGWVGRTYRDEPGFGQHPL